MAINIEKALAIDGYMTEKELTWLAEQAQQHKIIVEVGSYKGRSARALADNTDGILYCIDSFAQCYGNDDKFFCSYVDTRVDLINNLKDLFNNKVYIMEERWRRGLLKFQPDMIFIDADHRFENVVYDILVAKGLECKFICGHDYSDPYWIEVKKAVDYIYGSEAKQVEGTSLWYVDRRSL